MINRGNWMPDVFEDLLHYSHTPTVKSTAPAINVMEDDAQYTVQLAAPGLKKEDFAVNIDADGNLKIKMEQKSEKTEQDKNMHYLRREFGYAKHEQTLILPEDVDPQAIKATVSDGILSVILPKVVKEEKQVCREITIE